MDRKNVEMVAKMGEEFGTTVDETLDTIVTAYRAMRSAERLEKQHSVYHEFIKEDGKLMSGQRLYVYLLSMYRADMIPNPVATPEMRQFWEKEKDPGKSASWET